MEIVRAAWDAYSRGDYDRVGGFHDPHIVVITLEDGVVYGNDAVLANYKRWNEAWERAETTLEEVIGHGDRVFLAVRFQGRGRASGVEVETRFYEVYMLRDGKVLRIDEYAHRAEALEAAGLSERAMSEEENLAVVRRTIESFANDVETWLDTLDPAVEWHPDEEQRTLLRGRDAALRRHERWLETFQEGTYGLEIEELRGNGEHVFSDLREWGRGRGSGIVIEDHDYAHWRVRNGKVVYCCEYGTRAEALEAAGLSG